MSEHAQTKPIVDYDQLFPGEFLKAGACAVAVGAELVDAKCLKEGRLDAIEDRARQYLAVVA